MTEQHLAKKLARFPTPCRLIMHIRFEYAPGSYDIIRPSMCIRYLK